MPMTLPEVAAKMRGIDFCTLSTRTEGGAIAGRPMSNNGDVEYDGDSFFFAHDSTRTVHDIRADPKVGLGYQGKSGVLGLRPFFVTVEAIAELIRDKAQFEKHWTKDLERYFEQGVDTPGLVLIKAHASRLHYWDGEDEGEVAL